MRKVIIEVRANERANRTINPHVPFTPAEFAADAWACVEAGAAIYHYHGRSADGDCLDDLATHRDAVIALRSACDALVHPSLGDKALHASAAERFSIVLQLAADGLAPDIAPVGMAPRDLGNAPESELLGRAGAEDALRATIGDAIALLHEAGVTPYYDIWNMRAMQRAVAMLNADQLGVPALLMLSTAAPELLDDAGLRDVQPSTADGLDRFIEQLPRNTPFNWTALSYRANLLPLIPQVVAAGGHISIGLGDYPYPELGLPTNAALVAEVARILRSLGCDTATPAEARAMLTLRAQPQLATMPLVTSG